MLVRLDKMKEDTNYSSFSTELLLHIFSFLDAQDLCRCAKVCSFWSIVSEDHTLWRDLCHSNKYPVQELNHVAEKFNTQCSDVVEVKLQTSKVGPTWIGTWKQAYQWFYVSKRRIFKEGEIKNGQGSYTWIFNPTMVLPDVLRSMQQQLDFYFSHKKLGITCTYEGEWKDDMPHGLGLKIWSDGASFVGSWNGGRFHGYGTHSWASGNKYEGMWKNHMRNGYGSNTWPQKDCYEGDWLDDQKDGYGIYVWPDGRRYEGQWKKDKRTGFGIYYWSKLGCKYIGSWENDRREGHGKFCWSDGDYFEGSWCDGKRKGEGKFFSLATGKVYKQVWDEREFDAKNKGDTSQEIKDDVAELPTKRKFTEEEDFDIRTKKPKCQEVIAAN